MRSLNIFRYGREAVSLGVFFRILPFLGAHRFDIAHCHFGPNGVLATFLREAGVLRGRIVTSFHGYDMTSFLRVEGEGVYDGLFQQGDLFLPISERWKERLIGMGCPPEKTEVHRMGIDLARCRCRDRPADSPQVEVLSVARLVEKKGLEYGIRAVANLLTRGEDLRYSIVGDGPLREDLDRLIGDLGFADRMRILGWMDQEEVLDRMGRSHIFLAPSVTGPDGDQEGIPVVLMEAMALGLPVVSTHHSGIPELVKDGKTGFLVSERDPEGLAEKLLVLLQDPYAMRQMGLEGRLHIEGNYDIDGLNDRLVSHFERLLAGASI
jgi:colanic acid/amylovoran biosynthesis glycosyltransferase